ncbi:MAG TPA: hypothetical protein VFI31_10555 [Pirellulales bacterium]|nr:hypothetical protein [Pirellulales bacterium]
MPDPHRALSEGKTAALKLLKAAYEDAEDAGEEPRQFALGRDELMACGVSSTDLMWLLKMRYVEHVRELTRIREPRRQFHATGDVVLGPRSCFFLTYAGNAYVENNGFLRRAISEPRSGPTAKRKARRGDKASGKRKSAQGSVDLDAASRRVSLRARETPRWEAAEGSLYWRGQVILQLATHASAERMILDELERRGWTSPIRNPIPRDEAGDATQSRRHAVYNLNRHLGDNSPIEFFCLKGDLVGWRAYE